MKYTHKIRVWDQAASDDIFITEMGKVFNERGEQMKLTTPEGRVGVSVWSAIEDGRPEKELIRIACDEWADDYEGDPEEINAEVTAL